MHFVNRMMEGALALYHPHPWPNPPSLPGLPVPLASPASHPSLPRPPWLSVPPPPHTFAELPLEHLFLNAAPSPPLPPTPLLSCLWKTFSSMLPLLRNR